MCGIFGVLDRAGGVHQDALWTMREALRHRGPDDTGWLAWSPGSPARSGRERPDPAPAVALVGHDRLSIIDLSTAGWQPMSAPGGHLHVSFNGEIYNYLELRAELVREHRFVSDSDTEVLLAAWAQWGPACLERLVGMFALCVLDTVEQRAWLVRDQFGIKPLFYVERGPLVAFSSEIPALLDAGLASRRIAAQPLYDFLRSGRVDHRAETMLADIRRLPAGAIASIDLARPTPIEVSSYWDVPAERDEEMSFDDVVDDLAVRFRRSIELHVRSDVPVGASLSGGIDSSAIVCTMREVLGPDAEIHAFSYVAGDPRYDEERWIDLVGGAANATVHKVRVTEADLVTDVDDLVRSQGEPFGSTSILAQRKVFERARAEGVVVLLNGQGADELFGGYRGYLAGEFAGLVRSGHLVQAAHLARRVARLPDVRLGRREVARTLAGVLPARAGAAVLRAAGLGPFPTWLDQGWFEARGVTSGFAASSTSLEGALAAAFSSTSLPSLLRYEDRNSMRFSLESRVPFLEQGLVEAVFRYPRSTIVSPDGLTKRALRAALRGTVPDAVLDRRDKIGFTTPEDRWLVALGPWMDDVLSSPAMARVPGLVPSACRDDWTRIRDGRSRFDWRAWRWVNVARWADVLDLEAL